MERLGLRTRLVAAFVGIAALATLVAALLTSYALHSSLDGYLDRRADAAARSAVELAQASYARDAGWTDRGLDLLAHELVLTGYDFRLRAEDRALLDTTKLEQAGLDFRLVEELPVRSPDGDPVATLELFALGPGGNMPADDELRGEFDRGHLIAAAIAALVAIAAGLVVAGRLSRPLRRLAAAARTLGDGKGPPQLPTGGSAEVRGLSDALGWLADDLARQRRARRQLAQDLSHELRTPLMLLQSRIEAMQDGVVPFDADGLATLHTETLRLSRLIGQIELLAEAEAQPRPLRPEELALDEIARELHGTLGAAFEVRGLTLAVDAEPAPARGDRDAVRQIVTNLISNALKYAPDDDRVIITTRAIEGGAELIVTNGGVGIAAAERARIFERFFRGTTALGRSGGAGLGLTIARELAEAQGGRLELQQTQGASSFVLVLPRWSSARSVAAGGGGQRRPVRAPGT